MSASESIIRDHLARNLDVLGEGLVLIDIEKYLPNRQGTRGFVDILARDGRGRYVLIELKRSDAASRQAIHELLKYVEGIKANLSAKEDELRLLVVSTEWAELLVSFSSFKARTPLSMDGYLLTVNDAGEPISASRIDPLPIKEDRLFSPWHEVNLYTSTNSLKRGIKSYETMCRQKGIENFVLVELEADPGHRDREVTATREALNAMKAPDGQLSRADVEKLLPIHTHMLYFGMLQINSLEGMDLIRGIQSDVDGMEEFEYCIEGMEGDELANAIQEKLLDLDPRPHRDYFEIGYPAKFGSKIIDQENWRITAVHRFGNLKSNELLADETIVSELRGEQGVTGQRYVKEIEGAESSQIDVIRGELKKCLEDNPIWSAHLQAALDDISDVGLTAKTRISVFNPSNVLLTIYQAVTREDGVLYIPNFHVTTVDGDVQRMIYGTLSGTGKKPSMRQIVKDRYDGQPSNILWPLNWGGYQEHDRFVVRDAGLTYKTYKVVIGESGREFYEFTELGWEPCDKVGVFDQFSDYLDENHEFVEDVVKFFADHWNGFMTTFDNSEVINFKT